MDGLFQIGAPEGARIGVPTRVLPTSRGASSME